MKVVVALLATLFAAVAFAQVVSIEKQVPIAPEDFGCSVDSDCRIQKSMCNTYDCGTAVNTSAASKIYDQLYQMCPEQAFISADANCPAVYVKCDAGKCASHAIPGPVKVDQALQTCKVDTDCAVFQTDCQGTPCCNVNGYVGVSTSNLAPLEAEYAKMCDGVTRYDCTTVKCMQYEAKNTCVSGFCTVNGGLPAIVVVDPLPPLFNCDFSKRPSDSCVCTPTTVSFDVATGKETYSAEWVCPSTCSCDALPLPILDPAVDGCSNDKARFYCVVPESVAGSGSVSGSSGSGSTDPSMPLKRQEVIQPKPAACTARWEHTCDTKPLETQCVMDVYACGMGPCFDANQPRPMLACMTLWDPVVACEQSCMEKYGTCIAQLSGTTWGCVAVKSLDYDICVSSCKSDTVPVDKCSYLGDKCNCELNGCGWCESSIALDQPVSVSSDGSTSTSISYGYCASLASQFQCVSADRTFTAPTMPVATAESTTVSGSSSSSSGSTGTASDGSVGSGEVKPECPIIIPETFMPVPPDAPIATIDVCLADARCAAPVDLNKAIQTASASAESSSVAKIFRVVITAIIKSEGGIVNIAVDVDGDREPNTQESAEVCGLVVDAMAKHIGFDKSRVESCNLSKQSKAAQKRQTSVSNSYVANIRINNPNNIQGGSASALTPVFAAFFGLVAFLY